jgi:hypothetical protein
MIVLVLEMIAAGKPLPQKNHQNELFEIINFLVDGDMLCRVRVIRNSTGESKIRNCIASLLPYLEQLNIVKSKSAAEPRLL